MPERKERREHLEHAASEARAALSQRRAVLDDVDTITVYAEEVLEDVRAERRRALALRWLRRLLTLGLW